MKPENKGKSVLLEDGKIMKCPNFVQNGNCDGMKSGSSPEDWETISITIDDMETVL